MPELLHITYADVRPFDMVEEGISVRTITHFDDGRMTLGVGLLELVADPIGPDGCFSSTYVNMPVWSDMRELVVKPHDPVTVVRGLYPPPVGAS